MGFTHLHVHTEYSLLDGACRIERLPQAAADLGQRALAITDHGVLYGAIDFYKACKRAGVKPIIGCEVYVAPRSRLDRLRGTDDANYHLVLLCKDETGYQNLLKLVSEAHVNGFYAKPRIDFELLEQHAGGLICLSACLAGEIPQLLLRGDEAEARRVALRYRALFGEDYFIELQDHGLPEQQRVLMRLVQLARDCGIPMVATNDCHYIEREDAEAQRVLMAVQMGKTLEDETAMLFETDEFYLKSAQEMAERFAGFEGAIENTSVIADRCNLEFAFGKYHLPVFPLPQGTDSARLLRTVTLQGFAQRYPAGQSEAMERVEYELSVIRDMGFTDYFLIVWDFIRHAREQGIAVGPGRGSAAGSAVSYCLGITGIDPLKYDLLFERFLNPERVSMPDIDIDFCYERRGEVIDYVAEKYGRDHVAQIVTFGTMQARAAIRDTGRALGMSYADVDVVAKLVPPDLGMTLHHALEVSRPLRELYAQDQAVRGLVDMAVKLEGMPRHSSTHAAGVVITRRPVDCYVPLQKSEELLVTQYPMGTLEELGLLKMDFLGLRTLTLIEKASDMIRRHTPDFSIEALEPDDPKVYELYAKADTEGIFQFESGGMRAMLQGMRPTEFEDIVAAISLYRPGPMDSIPKYIEWKNSPEKVTYAHPMLEDILKVTYGCIVHQEQVLAILRQLAGFSAGRADLVRRAMSKKKQDVMAQERANFVQGILRPDGSVEVDGCVRRGVPEAVANRIFDEITPFASYAFNKSHAAAYALVSYRTAYLKCYHPKEFMAALLTTVLENSAKVSEYIGECIRMGIPVLPPDINESDAGFSVAGEAIRFGLVAVKNIGFALIEGLIAEREKGGPFGGLADFIDRMSGHDINKKAVFSLIAAGAFDQFGHNRAQLMAVYEGLMDDASSDRRSNVAGQLNLFGGAEGPAEPAYPRLPELPIKEKLDLEKEVTGFYLSGHPLSAYAADVRRVGGTPIRELLRAESADSPYRDGDAVTVAAVVTERRLKTLKNNSQMAFLTLEDMSGAIDCIVFASTLQQVDALLQKDAVVAMRARVSSKEEEGITLVCQEVGDIRDGPPPERAGRRAQNGGERPVPLSRGEAGKGPEPGLYLKLPAMDCDEMRRLEKLLRIFSGQVPVCIRLADSGRLVRHPLRAGQVDYLRAQLAEAFGEDRVAVIGQPEGV
ncbi:MAG: DNA polymerase III subunit alpha [Clostridiales bacterium]|nr:DNA polymerase III subunit alpha [Clostridiales bacterium]